MGFSIGIFPSFLKARPIENPIVGFDLFMVRGLPDDLVGFECQRSRIEDGWLEIAERVTGIFPASF